MAPSIGVNLRVTGHCNQGSRKHMEDMFSVAYQQSKDRLDLEYAYFGIFDGHGGSEAASYAKKKLMEMIVTQKTFWSNDDKLVCEAIKEGFEKTHSLMSLRIDEWPKTASGLPSTSGTTASVAFIRRGKIFIGHVGDSAIVLGQKAENGNGWKAVQLTTDHKPESPKELARIRACGGEVVVKKNVPRVVWRRPSPSHQGPLTRSTHMESVPFLAVARSLGDLWSYNDETKDYVVSPMPDLHVHTIDIKRDKCLILGTDGLFNMHTAQDAVDLVYEAETNNSRLKTHGTTWLNPSKFVVDKAMIKWGNLRADNTSAVVMLLDPLGPPKTPTDESKFIIHQSFKVKETKSESKGLAICTTSYESQGSCSSTSPDITGNQSPHAASKVVQYSPAKNKRSLRKRKRFGTRIGRRNTSVCSDSDPVQSKRDSPPLTTRTRRTRSEEPVSRSESDAENVDAPMRLRSATPFKTLRSRNIILDDLSSVQALEEPRPKRHKK